MTTLGQLLVADGVCSRQQLDDAVRNQVIMGGLLGTNLVEMGFIDETTLAHYLARLHERPTMAGDSIQPDPAALALLSPADVDRLNVIPFIKESKRLQILCVHPDDLNVLDEVAFITGLRPDPIVVPEIRFWQLLRVHYGINRQLRFVALNARNFLADSFLEEPSEPPPVEPEATEDLIDEEGFNKLYQSRDGFPKIAADLVLPSREMPLLSLDDLEEIAEEVDSKPPGGIERRVWQSPQTAESRRADDQQMASKAGAPPSMPPPQLEDITPLGFDEATRKLEQVGDRNAIARVVLRFALSTFKRCMLFTVHRGVALGWDALGEGLEPNDFRSMLIPLDSPSVFETVVNTRAPYVGGLAKTRANIQFLRDSGKQIPLSVIAIPVLVRGRVVNLLYVDNGHKKNSGSDIGELLILTQVISRSYEALFQRKKELFTKNEQGE